MRVIPDVVPSATPSVDLQVMVGEGAGIGDHGGEGGDVLAGVFLDPALVRTSHPVPHASGLDEAQWPMTDFRARCGHFGSDARTTTAPCDPVPHGREAVHCADGRPRCSR